MGANTAGAVARGHLAAALVPAIVCIAALLHEAAHAADPGGAVADLPVSFRVENVNRSALPCSSDGNSYVLRGSLVAPRSLLRSSSPRAATVYLQGGTTSGRFQFRFQELRGYDHAYEMARLGHASVVVDQLGYGQSGIPDGNQVCFGSWADVAHQVIGKLRSATYEVDGAPAAPAFQRIALAGFSIGGWAAEVEAYSFHDIDALVLLDSFTQGFSSAFLLEVAAPFGQACAGGGVPKGGSPGYAFGFRGSDGSLRDDLLYHNAEPAVIAAHRRAWEPDPCGGGPSGVTLIAENRVALSTVTSPVLIVAARNAALVVQPLAAEAELASFTASQDRTLTWVEDAGHMLTFQRSAPQFRRALSDWLRARAF